MYFQYTFLLIDSVHIMETILCEYFYFEMQVSVDLFVFTHAYIFCHPF